MTMGVVMIGIVFGFGAAGATHLTGAGVGATVLAYVAAGLIGTGMTMMAAMRPAPRRAVQKSRV